MPQPVKAAGFERDSRNFRDRKTCSTRQNRAAARIIMLPTVTVKHYRSSVPQVQDMRYLNVILTVSCVTLSCKRGCGD